MRCLGRWPPRVKLISISSLHSYFRMPWFPYFNAPLIPTTALYTLTERTQHAQVRT